jgi:hypothetical protein
VNLDDRACPVATVDVEPEILSAQRILENLPKKYHIEPEGWNKSAKEAVLSNVRLKGAFFRH